MPHRATKRASVPCLIVACAASVARAQVPNPRLAATRPIGPVPESTIGSPMTTFAVVGDFGVNSPEEGAVAALVRGLAPGFVITVGDDNYPDGSQAAIDVNIGQYYHEFIGAYVGGYGPGAAHNRFFPSLGNHDWGTPGAAPYLAYFTLPGNERYYEFARGPVRFFVLDSDASEPDGNTATSAQGAWLRNALAAATEPFRVVYFHHPPYSSGPHGVTPELQWPFREWGADVVIAGHDHTYERILREGFPYFVNGLGGAPRYAFGTPVRGSQVRYALDHGAIFAEATDELLTLAFVTRAGFVQDSFAIRPNGVTLSEVALVPAGSTWRYLDDGSDAGAAWIAPGFDDSGWSEGPAQLGFGDGDEATVVNSGPQGACFTTTYFRKHFQVADPTLWSSLTLELVRDDGAIVHLNGVEVFRSNMPADPIGASTFAASNASGADESLFYARDLAPTLLVPGSNVLAVEIHQSAPESLDASFDLRLLAVPLGTRVVARGSTWKYHDTGVSPPPTWIERVFDDSGWPAGPAQLGYGDGDEATVVSYGPDPNRKHVTTWFRKSFTRPAASTAQALALRILRDDGAAVYLNGVEIFRQNLPRFGLAPNSTTEYVVSDAEESQWIETYVDPRLLVPGLNVIAVEIHQFAPTSSDLSFDLELLEL